MAFTKKNTLISAGAVIGIGLVLVVYTFVYPSVETGKIEIRFDIPLAGSLAVVGIGIVLLFALLPDDKRPVLTFATALAGGIAAILSAFYIGQALKVNTERDKISRSVELINRLDGSQITAVRHFIETEILPKKMTNKEVYEAIEADEKLWNSVRMVLNQVENLSLSIQRGYADEEMLYKELAHMVPFYFENLYPFIVAIRRKHNYPAMYIEYEKLANSWKAQRLLYSGEKTPPLE